LAKCIEEISGTFRPDRKPWRTLIRVDDIDPEGDPRPSCYVVVPAWNATQIIQIRLDDLPLHVRPSIRSATHWHADVNIGAERAEDLYFAEWRAP
jgi:hypothetical protein